MDSALTCVTSAEATQMTTTPTMRNNPVLYLQLDIATLLLHRIITRPERNRRWNQEINKKSSDKDRILDQDLASFRGCFHHRSQPGRRCRDPEQLEPMTGEEEDPFALFISSSSSFPLFLELAKRGRRGAAKRSEGETKNRTIAASCERKIFCICFNTGNC